MLRRTRRAAGPAGRRSSPGAARPRSGAPVAAEPGRDIGSHGRSGGRRAVRPRPTPTAGETGPAAERVFPERSSPELSRLRLDVLDLARPRRLETAPRGESLDAFGRRRAEKLRAKPPVLFEELGMLARPSPPRVADPNRLHVQRGPDDERARDGQTRGEEGRELPPAAAIPLPRQVEVLDALRLDVCG